MITTIIALILAMLVCIVATSWKNDMLDSVSEIAYVIPHWSFTIWIALTGILIMPDIMEHLPENRQWIGFLCVVGLFLVAASSYYKTQERVLHYIGGWLCGICAMYVVTTVCWYWLFGWAVYVGAMFLCRWCCYTFWCEYTAFCMLCAAMLCR